MTQSVEQQKASLASVKREMARPRRAASTRPGAEAPADGVELAPIKALPTKRARRLQ